MAGGGRIYTDQVTVGDVTLYDVTGDPNGLLSATRGSLAMEKTTARLWQNTDGASAWVQIGGSAVVSAAIQVIRFPITAAGGVTQDSATVLPANAVVLRTGVEISSAFTAGSTIQVGKAGGTANLLSGIGDSDPELTSLFWAEGIVSWGVGAAAVRATIGGGPAAGVGAVVVEYVTVPNA